jgi:hypothetical protein
MGRGRVVSGCGFLRRAMRFLTASCLRAMMGRRRIAVSLQFFKIDRRLTLSNLDQRSAAFIVDKSKQRLLCVNFPYVTAGHKLRNVDLEASDGPCRSVARAFPAQFHEDCRVVSWNPPNVLPSIGIAAGPMTVLFGQLRFINSCYCIHLLLAPSVDLAVHHRSFRLKRPLARTDFVEAVADSFGVLRGGARPSFQSLETCPWGVFQ